MTRFHTQIPYELESGVYEYLFGPEIFAVDRSAAIQLMRILGYVGCFVIWEADYLESIDTEFDVIKMN